MTRQYVLQDLIEESKDGEWGKGEPFDGSVEMAVVRSTDFEDVQFGRPSAVPVRFIAPKIAERKALKRGDIIIETAGGGKDRPTGRTQLLRESFFCRSTLPITCASFCRFIRIDTAKADPAYIYWLLQYMYSAGVMKQFHTQHTGVARFQYTTFATTQKFSLPSCLAQRKIAGILSAYDDLIENNTRRIAILEEMAQSIYREWFVHFRFPGNKPATLVDSPLGRLPNDWKIVELTDLGFVGRGKSRHRPRNEPTLYGGPHPFFQTGDIKNANTYLWTYSQTYSEIGLAQSKLWNAGTLCITIAANIAETAILARAACFPDSVVGFVADPTKTDAVFVKMFLDSIKLKMQNASRGTTQDNLSLEKLLKFKIPSPPFLQIQTFRATVAPLLKQALLLFKKNVALKQARDLLLPKLISGQLDMDELDIEIGELDGKFEETAA